MIHVPRRWKIGCFLAIFIILCCVWAFFVYSINARYPNRVEDPIVENEAFSYLGYSLQVSNSEIVPFRDSVRLFGGDESNIAEIDLESKTLLVEITLRPDEGIRTPFPVTSLTVESGAWTNGLDVPLFFEMNDADSLNVSVEPSASCNIILPFRIYPSQFYAQDWKQLKTRKFYLVGAMYPITQKVSLRTEDHGDFASSILYG